MSTAADSSCGHAWQRALLRFIAAAVAGLLAALALGGPLVEASLPAVRAVVDRIDGHFRSVSLDRVRVGDEDFIERRAVPVVHVVGDHVVFGSAGVEVSERAAAGLLLQPLVFAFALLVAWPWRRAVELALRTALCVPILILVLAADVPVQLCGYLHYREQLALDPDGFSVLAVLADLMNAGGRFALTAAAVALATCAARRLTSEVPPRALAAAVGAPVPARQVPAPAGPQQRLG